MDPHGNFIASETLAEVEITGISMDVRVSSIFEETVSSLVLFYDPLSIDFTWILHRY